MGTIKRARNGWEGCHAESGLYGAVPVQTAGPAGVGGGLSSSPWSRAPARRLMREAYVAYRVIRSNLPSTLPTGVVIALAAWWHSPRPASTLWLSLGTAVCWSFLWLYVFDAANGVSGAPEDAVDKPERPIPAGLMTVAQAERRRWAAGVAYVVLGVLTDTWWCILPWLAETVAYCDLRWDRNPYYKALFTPVASLFFMNGLWIVGAGGTGVRSWTWAGVSLVFWLAVGFLQDQRDVAGDRVGGRRTFPMILHQHTLRVTGALLLAVQVPVLWLALHTVHASLPATRAATTAWAAVITVITTRLWFLRSARQDDLTYKMYAAAWSLLLAAAFL